MTRRWCQNWWWVVLAVWGVAASTAPWWGQAVNEISLSRMFAVPGVGLWLGADELGRAILPRVLAGAAISAPLAALVVAITLSFGAIFGIVIGWRGGTLELIAIRVLDLFQAFPGLLLAIALAGLLGPGLGNVALALCVVGWVGFARLARAQTASLKYREHVLAARALGTPNWRILLIHVVPLLAGPLLVEATFAFAATIAAEAGMSFLGLGAQPPSASWGSMLREATQFLLIAPHMLLGPGLAIISLVMAVQTAGERLREHWQVPGSFPIGNPPSLRANAKQSS
jgi:peptide/nickel transport system permease protein